jgi:phosphate transport system permease protein
MSFATLACVGLALLPLGSILFEAIARGAPVITFDFLTKTALEGGIANAIQGSLILIGLTAVVSLPVGVLTGIYLAEFGKNRVGDIVRFLVDVMTQTPSIVVGIFAWSFMYELSLLGIVPKTLVFSVLSGVIALSTILIPIVARTSEEALRLVPTSAREAALALGIPRYRTILRVVLPSCASALVTGGLLGIARVGGETAPLLVTTQISNDFVTGLDQWVSSLPVQVYRFAVAPSVAENRAAWGTSLILVLLMLGISIASRAVVRLRAVRR